MEGSPVHTSIPQIRIFFLKKILLFIFLNLKFSEKGSFQRDFGQSLGFEQGGLGLALVLVLHVLWLHSITLN